jgi:LysR family cys regulon transcriptional activator
MTLTQLRYLVAVADCGFNISRAAEALHTSQPGISRQIRVLESQLGTILLLRDGGRITGFSENGLRAVAAARRVLNEANSLTLMSEELMQQTSGKLTIATLHTGALTLLPPAVAAIRAQYPEVVVEIKSTSPAAMLELVQAGEVDLALAFRRPAESASLLSIPISTIPAALMAPEGHPLLVLETLTLEELARYPMVCHESLSAATWGMLERFNAKGIKLRPAVYAPDASVIQRCVAEGAGIAILPDILPVSPGVSKVDVSSLFESNEVTAVLDATRFHRGFVFDFIHALAPSWTVDAVKAEMRRIFFDGPR